jgi:hypothetical protein
MSIKILKNTTLSIIELNVLGLQIPASSQITIQTQDYSILGSSDSVTELTTYINSGDIVVNDGTDDLSISEGLAYVKLAEIAKSIRFDNSTNGFSSSEVQSAIEESKTSVVGSMFHMLFENNGTSTNIWLNYGANPASSNSVFAVMPFDCKLVACSFTNAASSVDLNIQVNIANQGSGNTVNRTIIFKVKNDRVATFSFPNSNNSNLLLNQGDKVGVYINDKGDNPNDPVVTLYFKVLEEVDQNTEENFSTNLSTTLAGTTVTFSQ